MEALSFRAAQVTTAPPRLLFVDDEPSICRAMQQLLTRHGFSTRVESTSEGAVAAVREERFDLVVLDFWLRSDPRQPSATGDDLYIDLTTLDAKLASRIMFVTGDPSERTQRRLNAIGATYLLKPFEIGLLVEVLRDRLKVEGVRSDERGDASSRTA
jgi:DNA-binding response OmpR family regulator